MPWRLSGGRLNERPSALRHCPRTGRAQQLAIVRNAHEETLREHGHDPAVDPGKTYVDLIMKGIELLLAELSNTVRRTGPTWGGGSEGADWEAHRDGRYQSSR